MFDQRNSIFCICVIFLSIALAIPAFSQDYITTNYTFTNNNSPYNYSQGLIIRPPQGQQITIDFEPGVVLNFSNQSDMQVKGDVIFNCRGIPTETGYIHFVNNGAGAVARLISFKKDDVIVSDEPTVNMEFCKIYSSPYCGPINTAIYSETENINIKYSDITVNHVGINLSGLTNNLNNCNRKIIFNIIRGFGNKVTYDFNDGEEAVLDEFVTFVGSGVFINLGVHLVEITNNIFIAGEYADNQGDACGVFFSLIHNNNDDDRTRKIVSNNIINHYPGEVTDMAYGIAYRGMSGDDSHINYYNLYVNNNSFNHINTAIYSFYEIDDPLVDAPPHINYNAYDDVNAGFRHGNQVSIPKLGTGNQTAAPMFVDEANDNYRLANGSPLCDAGTASEGTGDYLQIYTDIYTTQTDEESPLASEVDMGAYSGGEETYRITTDANRYWVGVVNRAHNEYITFTSNAHIYPDLGTTELTINNDQYPPAYWYFENGYGILLSNYCGLVVNDLNPVSIPTVLDGDDWEGIQWDGLPDIIGTPTLNPFTMKDYKLLNSEGIHVKYVFVDIENGEISSDYENTFMKFEEADLITINGNSIVYTGGMSQSEFINIVDEYDNIVIQGNQFQGSKKGIVIESTSSIKQPINISSNQMLGGGADYAVYIENNNGTVKIQNNMIDGYSYQSSGYGIVLNNVLKTTSISGNIMVNCNIGLYSNTTGGFNMSGNTIGNLNENTMEYGYKIMNCGSSITINGDQFANIGDSNDPTSAAVYINNSGKLFIDGEISGEAGEINDCYRGFYLVDTAPYSGGGTELVSYLKNYSIENDQQLSANEGAGIYMNTMDKIDIVNCDINTYGNAIFAGEDIALALEYCDYIRSENAEGVVSYSDMSMDNTCIKYCKKQGIYMLGPETADTNPVDPTDTGEYINLVMGYFNSYYDIYYRYNMIFNNGFNSDVTSRDDDYYQIRLYEHIEDRPGPAYELARYCKLDAGIYVNSNGIAGYNDIYINNPNGTTGYQNDYDGKMIYKGSMIDEIYRDPNGIVFNMMDDIIDGNCASYNYWGEFTGLPSGKPDKDRFFEPDAEVVNSGVYPSSPVRRTQFTEILSDPKEDVYTLKASIDYAYGIRNYGLLREKADKMIEEYPNNSLSFEAVLAYKALTSVNKISSHDYIDILTRIAEGSDSKYLVQKTSIELAKACYFHGDSKRAFNILENLKSEEKLGIKPVLIAVAYLEACEQQANLTNDMQGIELMHAVDAVWQEYNAYVMEQMTVQELNDKPKEPEKQEKETIEENDITLDVFGPNPFNASLQVSFTVHKPTDLAIQIYDVLGRLVTVLANDHFASGHNRVVFNAENYSSGVYFVSIQTANQQIVNKVVLLK